MGRSLRITTHIARVVQQQEIRLLAVFLFVFAVSLLLLLSSLNQETNTLFGLPALLVCLSGCFFSYLLLTIACHVWVFCKWQIKDNDEV